MSSFIILHHIQKQMEQLTKQIRMLIQKQSITPIKSEDYYRQYDGLVISFEKLKSKQDTLIQKQVDQVTVCTDGKMIFAFKDGTEIKV